MADHWELRRQTFSLDEDINGWLADNPTWEPMQIINDNKLPAIILVLKRRVVN
jgi:hypothetical protein